MTSRKLKAPFGLNDQWSRFAGYVTPTAPLRCTIGAGAASHRARASTVLAV